MKKHALTFTLLIGIFYLCPCHLSAQYNEQDIYNYIAQYQDAAIRNMYEYKIPASITIAQGIFESGCGKSRLAAEGNNHFGIKCHTDWTGDTLLIDDDELQECFRKYPTAMDSYMDHSLFLTGKKRYANLFQLDIMDYKSWATTLKADGYATNPQYAERLVGLIERYGISKLDTLYKERLADGYFEKNAKDVPDVVENKPMVQKETQPVKPVQNNPNPVATQVPVKPTPAAEKKQTDKIVASVKQQEMEKPAPATSKAPMKVFTAIGDDYPLGDSPFTYRKVFQNNNTYFIIAQTGDTYEKIAGDVQVSAANLRKFNDTKGNAQPVENEIVYVEVKGKNNAARVHVVQPGETLRYISQRYGVQLLYIFKYNGLDENSIIHPGDQILLRH